MPAFALLLGGYLHGVQQPSDGCRADPLAIHLLNSGYGSLLSFVVNSFAADFTITIGIPPAFVLTLLPQGDVVFQQLVSDVCF